MFKKDSEDLKRLVEAWWNILNSPSCYLIIARGFTPNKVFERFMLGLISSKKMKKLFATVLFPISFLFTPNMFGHFKFKSDDRNTKTKSKINNEFSHLFNQLETFSTTENTIIYYLGRDDINETLKLFTYNIFNNNEEEEEEEEVDE